MSQTDFTKDCFHADLCPRNSGFLPSCKWNFPCFLEVFLGLSWFGKGDTYYSNIISVSTVWCYEITAWQRVSGLRKKVRCDEDFLLIHICHFYLNLWANVLFSPTANFKIKAFALQDIPQKPQIKCNIDILIISSSPRQQERCPQHRNVTFFGLFTFQKVGTFPINEVLSVKAFWFWREQSSTPLLSSAVRWTKDTQAFCSSQRVVLVPHIQRGL